MQERALITSASNKFFPSLINLLGSITKNYPNHPEIFVYDLGLLWVFRKELERISGVTVLRVPPFVPFWRSCYTWKTYIFAHPIARLNFYLDAGCQVVQSLDSIFSEIERDDYFLVYQTALFGEIVPKEYKSIFNLSPMLDHLECIHAGIFGFKSTGKAASPIAWAYEAAQAGLSMGFSKKEQWRNKGVDKNSFVRGCPLFRHDLTLLNIGFRKKYENELIVHSQDQYAGSYNAHNNQYIWQLRLGFKYLDFMHPKNLYVNIPLIARINYSIVCGMLILKRMNLAIKKKLLIIPAPGKNGNSK